MLAGQAQPGEAIQCLTPLSLRVAKRRGNLATGSSQTVLMLLFNLVKTWTTTKWSIGMRLSNQAIGQIKQTVKTMLGDGSRVSVFGSRLDDNAKGGDIDLLIETDQAIGNEVALASRLSACLQIALGDQKIDVIVLGPQTVQQSIHQHAKQTAVAL